MTLQQRLGVSLFEAQKVSMSGLQSSIYVSYVVKLFRRISIDFWFDFGLIFPQDQVSLRFKFEHLKSDFVIGSTDFALNVHFALKFTSALQIHFAPFRTKSALCTKVVI